MQIIRQRTYARAGLMGNPSDGYNGKTISFSVRNFWAEVTLYEWEQIELLPSQQDHSHFGSLRELVTDVELHGYYGGLRLVKATVKRFAEFCLEQERQGNSAYHLSDEKFSVRYVSNIPRQVGLAGSSAIIIATLGALMQFYNVQLPKEVLPSIALSVENDELGIPGGLQDRVIQVYGGLVFMDFSKERISNKFGYHCGVYEPLDPRLLPPIYLAYTLDQSEPTEALHGPLRARFNRGDSEVVAAMQEFARYAVEARQALLVGDVDRLAALINQNFDLRRRICDLSPPHVRMIETARSVGASAKYAGSGGAIIGTYRDEAAFQSLQQELGKLNCVVVKPVIS